MGDPDRRAITSALVIGVTMLLLNAAGRTTRTKSLPRCKFRRSRPTPRGRGRAATRQGRHRPNTASSCREATIRTTPRAGTGPLPRRRRGPVKYRTDVPIISSSREDGQRRGRPEGFHAPQPRLFANIIEGISGGDSGVGCHHRRADRHRAGAGGVSALPVAVGMYICSWPRRRRSSSAA